MTDETVDAVNSDKSADAKTDLVDRAELHKVISERDTVKQKYRTLEDNLNQLKSEYQELKESINSRNLETQKKAGDVEGVQTSYESIIANKNSELEKIKQRADEYANKYTQIVVDATVRKLANEKLSDKGTELFLKLHKDQFTIVDDKVQIKEDKYSLDDLIDAFANEYGLVKNTVKPGIGISSDNTHGNNTWTLSKLDSLSDAELKILAIKEPQVLANYYNLAKQRQ
jgi:chromosome segregation ATPase